jgi:hypothetical protein
MAKKITRNPTTHSKAELPDALDAPALDAPALDAPALDELLDFIKLVEFKAALAALFNPAGMKELLAALFVMFPIFGIAGIILFIF